MTKTEARIVISRGQRDDLKAVINVYEPATGKLTKLNMTSGPGEQRIEADVRKLAKQLERAGNFVTFKDM